jgi:hypothetical protein
MALPSPFSRKSREKVRQNQVYWPLPAANSEDGSTLTPGPMVEEIATLLM